jgi:hypothetical protein
MEGMTEALVAMNWCLIVYVGSQLNVLVDRHHDGVMFSSGRALI